MHRSRAPILAMIRRPGNAPAETGRGRRSRRAGQRALVGLALLLLCLLLMPPARAASTVGAPWAWGINSLGEAGNGLTTNTAAPAAVRRLNGATAIAGG